MRVSAIVAIGIVAMAGAARGGLFNEAGTFGTGNLSGSSSIAVDDQGTVFITDWTNDVIGVFDASHAYLGGLTGFISPSAIAAAPNGTLYVGDVTRVLPMSKTGVAGEPIGAGTFNGIYQIVADAESNIFVADLTGNSVRSFSAAGAAGITITSAAGTALHGPFGVTVDAGHIYVSDSWNDRIAIFDRAGNFQSAFGVSLAGLNAHPGNIAVCDNVLYVNMMHAGLTAWSMEGQLLETCATIVDPGAVTVAGHTLYALDGTTHTVHVFEVPEAGTLAVMGIAAAGMVGRRRRVRWSWKRP